MTRKSKRFRCRLCSAEHVLKNVTFWIQRPGSLTRVPIFLQNGLRLCWAIVGAEASSLCERKTENNAAAAAGSHTLGSWIWLSLLSVDLFAKHCQRLSEHDIYKNSGNQSGPFVHYRGGSLDKFNFVLVYTPACSQIKEVSETGVSELLTRACRALQWLARG